MKFNIEEHYIVDQFRKQNKELLIIKTEFLCAFNNMWNCCRRLALGIPIHFSYTGMCKKIKKQTKMYFLYFYLQVMEVWYMKISVYTY